MSIVVFWLFEGKPHHQPFTDLQLSEALNFANAWRQDPAISHVTISSELSNSVGKAGVTSVEDGKTPDGHPYEWKKRRM
jgi:hypothetical protein